MELRRLVAVVLVSAAACAGGQVDDPQPTQASTTATPATSAPATGGAAAQAPATGGAAAVWDRRAAAPTARQEVASAVAGGRVWVIGGLTAAGASSLVEIYDPAADRWEPGPPLPVALHHPSAVTFRGEVVVLGGFLGGESIYARPSDRVLALRGGAWVDLAPLRRPRGAAAAAVVDDVLVVAGGRDSSALVGPTEIFDGAAWRDAEPILTRRDHLSAVSDGRSLFTVGGRFLQPGAVSAALERFDPATGAWERLPAMPTARGGHGAAVTATGGRLVVAGGEDPTKVYAEVEAYDIAAQRWAALAPMATPRHGMALERVGDTILALAGGTSFGLAPSAVAEALSPLS